jgi:hypothetical protein
VASRENAFQAFSTNNSKAQIPWKFHGTLMGVKIKITNGEKCNVFIGFSEDLYSVKSCRNFIINATNSELFIHELKYRIPFVISVRKPLLGEQKLTTHLDNKIYYFQNFYIFHNLRTQAMHTYQKLHFMNRIVELRAVSKLSYFFWYTLYIYTACLKKDATEIRQVVVHHKFN